MTVRTLDYRFTLESKHLRDLDLNSIQSDSTLKSINVFINKLKQNNLTLLNVNSFIKDAKTLNLSKYSHEIAVILLGNYNYSFTNCYNDSIAVAGLIACLDRLSALKKKGLSDGTATEETADESTSSYFGDAPIANAILDSACKMLDDPPSFSKHAINMNRKKFKINDDESAAKVPDYFLENSKDKWNVFIQDVVFSFHVIMNLLLFECIDSSVFLKKYFSKLSPFFLSSKSMASLRSLIDQSIEERLSFLLKNSYDVIDNIDDMELDELYGENTDPEQIIITSAGKVDSKNIPVGYTPQNTLKSILIYCLINSYGNDTRLDVNDTNTADVSPSIQNFFRQVLYCFYSDYIPNVILVRTQHHFLEENKNSIYYQSGKNPSGLSNLCNILTKQIDLDFKIVDGLHKVLNLPQTILPYSDLSSIVEDLTLSDELLQLSTLCFNNDTNLRHSKEKMEMLKSINGNESLTKLKELGLFDDYDYNFYINIPNLKDTCPPISKLSNKIKKKEINMFKLLKPEMSQEDNTSIVPNVSSVNEHENNGLTPDFPTITFLIDLLSKTKDIKDLDEITNLLAYRTKFKHTSDQLINLIVYGNLSFVQIRLYARTIATLNPFYPFFLQELLPIIVKKITYNIYNPTDIVNFESPVSKFVYLICELSKFRIISINFILFLFRLLCRKLEGSNMFLFQTFLRSTGSFLLTLDNSRSVFCLILRSTIKKIRAELSKKENNQDLITQLKGFELGISQSIPEDWGINLDELLEIITSNFNEDVFDSLYPNNRELDSEQKSNIKKVSISKEQTFSDLFFIQCESLTIDNQQVITTLKSLDWTNDNTIRSFTKCISTVWLYSYNTLPKLAFIIWSLRNDSPPLVTSVIDTIFEYLYRSLEYPTALGAQHTISIARMIGFLYFFGLVPKQVALKTLFEILSYGHPNGHPIPYRLLPHDQITKSTRIRLFVELFNNMFQIDTKFEFLNDVIQVYGNDLPPKLNVSTPILQLNQEDAILLVELRTAAQFLNLYYYTRLSPASDITIAAKNLLNNIGVPWTDSYDKIVTDYYSEDVAKEILNIRDGLLDLHEQNLQKRKEKEEKFEYVKEQRASVREDRIHSIYLNQQYKEMFTDDLNLKDSNVSDKNVQLPEISDLSINAKNSKKGKFKLLVRKKGKNVIIPLSNNVDVQKSDQSIVYEEDLKLKEYILHNF